MNRTFIIAEVGINHNGSLLYAMELMKEAKKAGADAVKFQKRTIDIVYTKEELDKYRESPWGTTNREQKEGLEFGKEEYDEIDKYAKELGIEWFASAWDLKSQKFLQQYDCKYNKVASAMLGHHELLEMIAKEHKHTFISTGMSTLEEISGAVLIFREYNCPFELMHCNSQYPMKPEDANLACINTLKYYFKCDNVGYSGHEVGLTPSVVATVLGATSIERHITLDRAMYGSDQSASVQIDGFKRLVEYIREAEVCIGDGVKTITEGEKACRDKLRKVKDNA